MTSTNTADPETRPALQAACHILGLDVGHARLIRSSENTIYQLPGAVVVRIGRPGQTSSAVNEVNVARWLESAGVPAVQVLPDVEQPVEVAGRPVTFWRELPPHQHGTPVQVALALRRLHSVPQPATFQLPPIAPFIRLEDRINGTAHVDDNDRAWMLEHLASLEDRYAQLPAGLPACVVHGDAWIGNVVATSDGRVVLVDLERTAIGPPEWDLVHTAIKHASFRWIDATQYQQFHETYGHDVTTWDGYELLRDIREFRMTCMALQLATTNPAYLDQATHRLASVRGKLGPRPWNGWHPVP